MFNGNGNNNNPTDVRSVNTRIKTFYGETACIQVTYWDENISIKINPLLKINEDGTRNYDYNRRISTALTPEKCLALKEAIDKTIKPAIKTVQDGGKPEKAVNVGCSVGNKGGAIFFEYKEDDKGVYSTYLTYYSSISDDGKAAPENTFRYKFNKVTVNENYDSATGNSKETYIEAEFNFIYNKLKDIADLAGSIPHAINRDAMYKSTSSGKNSGGSFNAGNNEHTSNYSAPVSDFSAEDFSFMN